MKKLTIEFVREEFEKEGYTLLSTKYKSAHDKVEFICPNGHKHAIAWHYFQQGRRCVYCVKHIKPTIEEVKNLFEKEGYTLLSTKYKSAHEKLEVICPNGHKRFITRSSFRRGNRCAYCSKKIKPTIEEVRSLFEKEGYTLLSTEYKDAKTKLEFTCPNGHSDSMMRTNWDQGCRCCKCVKSGVRKLNIPLYETYAPQISYAEEVRPYYDEEGRKLLEVKCTYCGKWFVPKISVVRSRVSALNGRASGEQRFYCSQECKDACPIYGAILYPKGFIKTEELPYTTNDLHVWSQEVLERAEHKCEICGEPAEHAHHIIPKKLEPFLATDPENGLAVCVKCHYEHCHTGECSTGNLANKVCKLISS